MDLTPILFQQMDRTAPIVEGVTPDQLSDPTPCAELDVRGLLNHLIGGTLMFSMAAEGQEFKEFREPPDFVANGAAGAYRDATERARKTWGEPGVLDRTLALPTRPMPSRQALRILLVETVVHGWDLAKATGQPATIDPVVAAPILDGLRKVFTTPESRGSFFGPPVEVGDDAPAGDRLVAFLGRTP